jgi:hypothetical protein
VTEEACRRPSLDAEGYPLNGFDEVVPGLWQGDTTFDPWHVLALGYDALFDLCGWDRGKGLEDLPYTFHHIDDAPWINDKETIDALARQVADLVRGGKKVAVNCAAGLNRSGLLVARALIDLGHEPAQAVFLVRQARGPWALSNVAFAKYLLLDCLRP